MTPEQQLKFALLRMTQEADQARWRINDCGITVEVHSQHSRYVAVDQLPVLGRRWASALEGSPVIQTETTTKVYVEWRSYAYQITLSFEPNDFPYWESRLREAGFETVTVPLRPFKADPDLSADENYDALQAWRQEPTTWQAYASTMVAYSPEIPDRVFVKSSGLNLDNMNLIAVQLAITEVWGDKWEGLAEALPPKPRNQDYPYAQRAL
mgnify:CR=1 FL=1